MNLRKEGVLVTGGSGFLGSFVCERLHEEGVRQILVPRSKDYDLTKQSQVRAMYKDFEPSIIFHLAAVVGGIGMNREKPGEIFYKNLRMGTSIIEEARRFDVKKVVAINTSCAYPGNLSVPFREEEFWDGYPEPTNAPYGMAKKMMLVQAEAYKRQYGSPTVINLIPANLYGPRDNFDYRESHVIPAMIRRFSEAQESNNDEVTFWGTGDPTRDFLYVEDAAEAVVRAGREYNSVKPLNIASGREVRISELAQILRNLTEYRGNIAWDEGHPDGRKRVRLDPTRAKDSLNFEVSTTLREGLERTVQWFYEHKEKILDRPNTSGLRGAVPDYIRTTP